MSENSHWRNIGQQTDKSKVRATQKYSLFTWSSILQLVVMIRRAFAFIHIISYGSVQDDIDDVVDVEDIDDDAIAISICPE